MFSARWTAAVIFLITCAGLAIRLYNLDAQSVWYDEAGSVAFSARPLDQLFTVLIDDVVHPPLHYVVLHGWFKLAGVSAINARLVSVLFGTLSIPIFYLLARRFTDTATSLIAAVLLAISQAAVYYSQEARPYAQAQFFSLLAAIAFITFLRAPGPRTMAGFTLSAIALVYTNYYGSAVLLALGLYWLIFRRDFPRSVFRYLSVAVTILVLVFIPWVIALKSGGRLTSARLSRSRGQAGRTSNLASPVAALVHFNNSKLGEIDAPAKVSHALPGVLLFTLPIAVALFLRGREIPRGLTFGLLYTAIPAVTAILIGATIAGFHYRYYVFAVPGYYLAVAIAWRICLPNGFPLAACLAAVAIYTGFALRANQISTKSDYRTALRPLAESVRPGDCISGRPRIWKTNLHFGLEVYYRDRPPIRFIPFDSIGGAHTSCERLWIVWDRTWWMNTNPLEGEKEIASISALSANYRPAERFSHPAIDIQLLVRKPAEPE